MNTVSRATLSEAKISGALAQRAAAHYAVLEANFLTRGLWAGDTQHDRLVAGIDQAVAALAAGKWYLGRATGDIGGLAKRTGDAADFTRAALAFDDARRIAEAAAEGKTAKLETNYRPMPRAGTEILWVGDIPIVPSIAPLVVLQGSSRAMGEQYMRQVVGIFGGFVFAGFSARGLRGTQRQTIDRWAEELKKHAPGTVEFALGMSDGARTCGIDLSPHEALAMWTGVEPPPKQLIGMTGLAYFGVVEDIPDPCSGACGWGSATKDGRLYLGSSTDHDCTFQATIVAYPEKGNSYIYTPFSVNGYTTFVGDAWFAGHPGINSKGLAYVQHGAGCEGAPESDHWGYGVRRGASTIDILQHQADARGALEKELSLPLGDGASILGTVGGFYANRDFGYVIESREPSRGPVVRYQTLDAQGHKMDVLYANNNNIDPRSGTHWAPPAGGYRYELEAGWFMLDEPEPSDNFGVVTRQMCAKSSESRNRYAHRRLSEMNGSIDLDGMSRYYRQGPVFPDRPWREIEAAYKAGERFEGSPAQRGNAFVAIASPGSEGDGVYRGCVGPITHRSVAPHKAGHGYIYHDETNELWEVTLPRQLDELLPRAQKEAGRRIEHAQALLGTVEAERRPALERLANEAAVQVDNSQHGQTVTSGVDGIATALRSATRAQVRAAQAISAAKRGEVRGS